MIDPNTTNDYKDSLGRYRTQSLFWEHRNDKYPCFFTLSREDKHGVDSLYRRYMEIADPTEYQVGLQLFGEWRHWEVLTNCEWFKPYLEDWRRELEIKRKSELIQKMQVLADNATSETTRANAIRWLEANTTEEPANPKRGRPSKNEVEARLKRELKSLEEFDDDAKRLGIQ